MANLIFLRCPKCDSELSFEEPKNPQLMSAVDGMLADATKSHARECDGQIVRTVESR